MHRVTPLNAAYVAFTGGGARSVVDSANDDPMMQEMKGNFQKGESRDKIEAPQNYGFTSRVLPATKGKDGQIEKGAEAVISFMGGNRSFPVASVMDDRRFRPMGLKPGENAQYDDIGQMTLMRRNGLFMLSHDGEDGEGKKSERYVSVRHVEKKKQERGKVGGRGNQGGGAGQQAAAATAAAPGQQAAQSGGQQQQKKEDYKHEGESVNTEVRCTAKRIEFRTGEKLVGHYDKGSDTWELYESGGKFKVIISPNSVIGQYQDSSKSFKVDSSHTHIKFGPNAIWVNAMGCFTTQEIVVAPDPN